MGIQFNRTELVREVKTLRRIASEFFERDTVWALDRFRSALEAMSGEAVRKYELEVLRTKPNMGAHEAGQRRGTLNVYAGITGCWELRLENKSVEFCGLASTKIELFDAESDERVAMWRVELGAADAPGCYFHVQILGDEDSVPFPHTLSIPRLPSVFVSPMAAIEYALGELFQDEWEKAVCQLRPDQDYWRRLQRERLCGLLSWQEQRLRKSVGSSPWMTLKAAKPDGDLYGRRRT